MVKATPEIKRGDRRTNRTRRLLRESLLALVLEKGYEAVTVEEITEHADLGRTTFYLHYRDKEDLLLESIDDMADDLIEIISQTPLSAWGPGSAGAPPGDDQTSATPFRMVFEHAARYGDLYRIILRGEGRSQATGRLHQIIIRAASRYLESRLAVERPEVKPRIPYEVFTSYFAGALLGTVTWWLENSLPYPPQEMAEMFERMLFQGAKRALGFEEAR